MFSSFERVFPLSSGTSPDFAETYPIAISKKERPFVLKLQKKKSFRVIAECDVLLFNIKTYNVPIKINRMQKMSIEFRYNFKNNCQKRKIDIDKDAFA